MKLYFLLPSLKTGGGSRVIFEIAQILSKTDEVFIIAPNNSKELNTFQINATLNIKLIGKPANTKVLKLFNIIKSLLFLRKRKNAKVIYTDPIMSIFSFLLKKRNTYRFIQADDYCIYDDGHLLANKLLIKAYKFSVKLSYSFNHSFIFNSKYTFNQFQKVAKRKDVDYMLVHPALNHNFFYPSKLEKKEQGISICLVGRVHPWKGFKTFAEAWASLDLRTKEKISNIYVISHDEIEHLCLPEFKIIKPNNDQNIGDIMRSSEIFISTSWWEGFGLPPLEAMACGCAVITSSSGGINEYALNEINCLMIPPKDKKLLAVAIEKLITDSALREKLSKNGITKSLEFNWKKSTLQLKNILQQCN